MPSTEKLIDGHSTVISLANISSVKLFEKSVTPPGFDGGGAIDITDMRNTAWRTFAPKQLKTLQPLTTTVAYSTDAYEDVMDELLTNQLITLTFPDTTTFAFYGYIESFVPDGFEEGNQPTATMTLQPTLRDNASPPAETAPVYAIPSGAT